MQLRDEYCEVFYDKLTYIFIEMPRFTKTESELITTADKWLYFLKNLEDFNEIPNILNEPIFQKGFEIAKMANFNEQQRDAYELNLKTYRDWYALEQTQKQEVFEEGWQAVVDAGIEQGIEQSKVEIAKQMKFDGLDVGTIAKYTGLSESQIEQIK